MSHAWPLGRGGASAPTQTIYLERYIEFRWFYHYIIDLLSTLGCGGLEVPEIVEVIVPVFSKAANLRLCQVGHDQNDGLDKFNIGFFVWDRGGHPCLIVSVRVQDQVLQRIY